MISALERPEETGSTLQAHRGGMRRGGPAAAAEDFLTHVSKGALDCVDRSVREHNHHRHTALGGQPPVTCVDNLPAYYNWLT